MKKAIGLIFASTSVFAWAPSVQAQTGDASAAPTSAQVSQGDPAEGGMLDEIVVTATPQGVSKMRTSVSTSSLSTEDIQNSAPRSVAEIFRNIPGIRSESSGGGGNANIAVRGLPISTGGAKFLSLQEDGLPVMSFGDVPFGTADNFVRADTNILRVEAIRGGLGSTFAQNSPGGVINFISKTGQRESGSVGFTRGVDFGTNQIDFEYGAPVANGWSFHVGGYYRVGEGARRAGYTGDNGGQIKANITKDFNGGYVRLYLKHLDDRTITYLPAPVIAEGTNDKPTFRSIPGFDIKHDTLHSPYFLTNFGLDGNNNFRTGQVKDGIHAKSDAVGVEFQFDLPGGVQLTDRGRYARNRGSWIAPFPQAVGSASAIAASIAGAGATLAFANGPNAGRAITDPSTLNGNGLAATVTLFDVDIKNFDNFTNDLRLSKNVGVSDGTALDLVVGYYKTHQTIAMDYLWQSYVEGIGRNAALLNVFAANGTPYSINGLYKFDGLSNNRRTRNVDYDIDAPFASITLTTDTLTLDGSVRYTWGNARGTYASAVNRAFDMNGDGAISVPEQTVPFLNLVSPRPVNYDYDFIAYSFGANYLVTPDLALFARYSRGGAANSDRLLFGPKVQADGSLIARKAAYDIVRQTEAGVKYRQGPLSLFATGFYTLAAETNYQVTTNLFTDRDYRSYGLELEGQYAIGGFAVRAGGTYTHARIIADRITPTIVGNTPRRQAAFTYQVTPSYTTGALTAGVNVIGTTSSYSQDVNQLKLPGYAVANMFVNYDLVDGLTLSLNVNNAFNALGITEAENASITANATNYIRARAINGRTTSVSLRYSF